DGLGAPFRHSVHPKDQGFLADGKFLSAFATVKLPVPKISVDKFSGWNRMTAARNGHARLEK
ncbi:MAG: hypothetical protein ACRD88_06500, partial [Terriglobia bacterium]